MKIVEKAFFLRKTSIFSEVNLDHLLILSDELEEIHFSKGENIFKKNDHNTKSYLITKGSVNCFGDNWSTLVYSPYFFGEETAFGNSIKDYTACCMEASHCLIFDQETLEKAIIYNPEIALKLLERILKNSPSSHIKHKHQNAIQR